MASAEPTDKKKKKRLSFKGGLNKIKNLKKGKKENNQAEQQTEDGKSKEKKRRVSFTKKTPVKDRPKLPKLDLASYSFPEEIMAPSESWAELQFDAEDKQIKSILAEKYKAEIEQLKFFPSDILIRFTLSQRGLVPFTERQKETEMHFRSYLKFHKECNYDDVLTNEALNSSKSLSDLSEDKKALSLFIYGQDKEGHPIFWDDGTAYSKEASLEIFKGNLHRANQYRSRIMRRMHNIKLTASKKYKRMIYKHCLVMDLSRFNAKQFVKDRKFHEKNTKDLTDQFPEVMHKLYVINAPWAFRSAWKVIQTFLHPITVQKTKILGKDYIDELQKDINLDMIPHKYGGVGPWDIVYGEEPLNYMFKTESIQFDYSELPENDLPIPERAAAPDMNKHRAKQKKQLKMKVQADDDGDIVVLEEELDDEKTDGDEPSMQPAKSAPAAK